MEHQDTAAKALALEMPLEADRAGRSEKERKMAEALLITLLLIVVTSAGILGFLYFVKITQTADNEKKIKLQGVVKHDWLPTGRIDFTARFEDVADQSKDKPGEFRLLVEERRIVESIAGNESLEIQWRLATLSEAKAVVTQYHKYLSENSLIKSIPELFASLPAPHLISSPPPTNSKQNPAEEEPLQESGAAPDVRLAKAQAR
jgi:hypothetical protein